MGTGAIINTGPNWNRTGYHWFMGGSSIGHLGPNNNGTTDKTATNAILTAAKHGESAMVAAMPLWLSGWFTAQDAALRAEFVANCATHPGVL